MGTRVGYTGGQAASTGTSNMAEKEPNELGPTARKILAVARREFASHGFSGARMDRMAKLAKCNIRMLYHYFSSKEGLYLHVVEELLQEFREREEFIKFDLEDPVASIEDFFRFMCEYFTENEFIEGIIKNENLMEGKFIKKVNYTGTRKWLDTRLFALVEAGKRKKVINPDVNHLDLYLTISALSRYHLSYRYTLSAFLGVDMGSAEWRERRVAEGLEVLRAYIAPRPAKKLRASNAGR